MKKKIFIILLIFFCLTMIYFFISFLIAPFTTVKQNKGYLKKNDLMMLAHRGGANVFPENTIEGFKKCMELSNMLCIELDVHSTSDGFIVVCHDASLKRTTGIDKFIKDMTFSEVKQVDAAKLISFDEGKTFPYSGKGIKIPTLSSVIKEFPESKISIEIKDNNPEYYETVIKIIHDHNASNRVVICSEMYDVLHNVRKIAPEICTGLSKKEVLTIIALRYAGLLQFYKPKGDVIQIPTWSDYENKKGIHLGNKKFIDSMHKKGLKVHYWTIDDADEMKQLILSGADGIITNRPDLLLEVAKSINN